MSETERQMAVRSLRALQRVDAILEKHANEWEEVDEYLRGQFQDVRDAALRLRLDIEETHPGRRKSGRTAS